MPTVTRVSGRVGPYILLTNADGIPGSQLFVAPGVPSSGLGTSGDVYINSLTADVYKRFGASWGVPALNLTGPAGPTGSTGSTGPTGPQGIPGSQIYTASGAPSSGLGVNGDFYLDTATSNYYVKAGGAWTLQGNLSGAGFTGPAGGALTGSYPNPDLADGAVTDAKVSDVAYGKLTGAPASLPPSGAAGGVLTGSYPNPTLGTAVVTDGNVNDVAYGKLTGAPASLPPSGAAGGDLTGAYPNPAISVPVMDARITAQKGNPNGLCPLDGSGHVSPAYMAVGDMVFEGIWSAATNTPTLANGTGTKGLFYKVSTGGTQDLGSGPITFRAGDSVIYDGSEWVQSGSADAVQSVNGLLGAVVIAALPPNGAAGGALTGSYPNPSLALASVADSNIVDMAYGKLTGAPAALPPNGAAGGALTGSYPNPSLALASVADSNIVDMAYGKLTGAPTALPPSGAAGGSLAGMYPNPSLAAGSVGTTQIVGASVTDAKIVSMDFSKLTGAPSQISQMQTQAISPSVIVPNGYTWVRGPTYIASGVMLTVLGSGLVIFL